MSETLPALVVTSEEDSKRTLKMDRNKPASFTNLYRKAVINKGWDEKIDISRKEMEFMDLPPSKKSPRRLDCMYRCLKKTECFQKKIVSFSIPSGEV